MTTKITKPDTKWVPDELKRLADEIRVRIHLAGMDARDAWARLEPQVRKLERRAHDATDKVASEVKQLGAELERELRRLRDSMHNQ